MRSSSLPSSWALLAVLSLLCLLQATLAVKENDFKKCKDSGFCKRNRAYADHAIAQGSKWTAPYQVTQIGELKDGQLQAVIVKTWTHDGDSQSVSHQHLPLTISFLKSGSVRVTMDELERQNKNIELRHNSPARKERYNEAEYWALAGGMERDPEAKMVHQDDQQIIVQYGKDSKLEALIKLSPFEMDFRRDGVSHIRLNERGLVNMETWRPKLETDRPNEDESTWWDETFGGNTDSKPRGPESVGLDISFVDYDQVFGIPEHTGPMSLRQTRGGSGQFEEPYRMYNTDVFEYVLDSPMTLYGSIPFMQAHRKGSSVGVLWLSAAETWVDITKEKRKTNPMSLVGGGGKESTNTHWFSESGVLDVFILMETSPAHLSKTYGELTGYTAMPQEFAIGYHQCRWNYVSDDDVKDVDRKMDKFRIPYDVIWLDLEYTDDRKYFTWQPDMFADPIGMGKQLEQHARNLVVLIDPHIKKLDGYDVSTEIVSKDLAVHDKEDKLYEGWCWPGASNWIDCFNPAAIKWWTTLFKYDRFHGTLRNTHIWNDMNEPSVFNGPETTMPKDNMHFGGWEHRDVHNINGLTFVNATYNAMVTRTKGELRRPFILTRSYYVGSQRMGAMWTGDNQANWEHLGASLPMVLNNGISGFPFAGADVGGFFGDPEKELLVRWYQTGIFYPFFRAHAHIDSRRREPYLLGEPYTDMVTAAIRLRYTLLPAWYTAFFEASRDGSPIVRPMFWTHPEEEDGYHLDDQLFVGSTGLLAKPIVGKDQTSTDIWIPDDEVYYDYFTFQKAKTSKGKHTTVEAGLDSIPLLMRGGHVIPRRNVPRRSAGLMRFDDYTLVVSLSRDGTGAGELYVDDGDTFDNEQGQYLYRRFEFGAATTNNKEDQKAAKDQVLMTSVDAEGRDVKKDIKPGHWMKAMQDVYVDKIVIVGVGADWQDTTEVTLEARGKSWSVGVQYHPAEEGRGAFAVVQRVGARIGEDWTMRRG